MRYALIFFSCLLVARAGPVAVVFTNSTDSPLAVDVIPEASVGDSTHTFRVVVGSYSSQVYNFTPDVGSSGGYHFEFFYGKSGSSPYFANTNVTYQLADDTVANFAAVGGDGSGGYNLLQTFFPAAQWRGVGAGSGGSIWEESTDTLNVFGLGMGFGGVALIVRAALRWFKRAGTEDNS